MVKGGRKGVWIALRIELLPCAFDAEGVEVGGFFFVEVVLDELVDAGAARAAAEARAQFGQIFDGA